MKIAESIDLFLKDASGAVSKKTAEKYGDVLKLFHWKLEMSIRDEVLKAED